MQLTSFPAIWLLFYETNTVRGMRSKERINVCVFYFLHVSQVPGIFIQALGKNEKFLHRQ